MTNSPNKIDLGKEIDKSLKRLNSYRDQNLESLENEYNITVEANQSPYTL